MSQYSCTIEMSFSGVSEKATSFVVYTIKKAAWCYLSRNSRNFCMVSTYYRVYRRCMIQHDVLISTLYCSFNHFGSGYTVKKSNRSFPFFLSFFFFFLVWFCFFFFFWF